MAKLARGPLVSGFDPFTEMAATSLSGLVDATQAAVRDNQPPAAQFPPIAPAQIVFIEANVPDAQDLANGVRAGIQTVLLDPSQDGVQQIAAYLASHAIGNLAGIDIVAHGADGAVQLGSATLTSGNIADYRAELAAIGAALAPGGAIQLFGCDVGQDAAGVAFLDQLSVATGGANIVAASHLVGDAAGGGSFNLDINVGTIAAATPFTTDALTSFKGELSLSTTVPQLYVVWSADANGPTSTTRLEQLGISGSTFVSSGSIDLADASTIDLNQLRGVAFDAPLDRYFLSQAADQSADLDSAMLFEGTIGAVAAPGAINISGSSSIFYTGLAFDPTANKVYLSEQVYGGLTSGATTPMTSTIDGIGIYSFSPSANIAAAVTPAIVIYGHSTITGGGTLQGPDDIAVVPNANLLIFTDDQEIFLGNGSAHIDVGNVVSHQWTTLAIPGSIISTAVDGAAALSVAVDATSATGGILFFAVEDGTTANNGIYSAGYTITGSGSTQSASLVGTITPLYTGAAAKFPTDIVVNPIVTNGTVTGNGTLYISSTNGTIYAGNMAGGATLTAVGDLSGGSSAGESLAFESLPTIVPSGGLSYTQGTTVTLNGGLALANTDIQNLVSATVTVAAGDTLHYATVNAINGSFSSGILTLTGTTSAANYQAALDSITFSSTAAAGTHVVNWAVSDGVVIGSGTSNVTIASALSLSTGGTVSFTAPGTAVVLDPTVTITAGGSLASGTITVGNALLTGDTLNFINSGTVAEGNIAISSNSNGTLVLSSASDTATNTQWQNALEGVTYSITPANGDPTQAGNDTSRTVNWLISDGSSTATSTSTLHTTLSATLIYGQTVHEVGIVAATETVAAGVMTLKNASATAVGTINVGASLVTNDFALTTISGNTDVIENTVFGTYTSGVTLLVNPTTIVSTARITGTVASATGVYGPSGTAWTLVNAGKVSETGSGSSGVVLKSGGTVTNSASAAITAFADGIYIRSGAGSVSNLGSIVSTAGVAAIYLSGGGSVTNASGGTIAGHSAGVFIANGTGATVSNAGSISASQSYGIWLVNGGTVTNAFGGIITGGYATADAAGVYLGSGGAVTNQSGGTIGGLRGVYVLGGAATVVNAGHLVGSNITIGTGAASTGAGVYLGAGGSVTNQAGGTISGYDGIVGQNGAITVVNTGVIAGYYTAAFAAGVDLNAGGSVTNQSGGTISGYDGISATSAAITVVNAGTIAGNYTSNYQHADGVNLNAGGTVTNQATGNIYGRNDGVLISGARGTVFNLGTIHSRVDATYGASGISLAAGGVIVNGASGAGAASTASIAGYNYAVEFGATGTDTLVNYGTINGSPGTVAVSMYTGTLTNGASALIESGLQSNAVLITGAGTVVNYGSINGLAANGEPHVSYGVSLGGSGTVASSIRNLGANALISGYVAVYAAQNATVTNGGTLEATQTFGGTAPIEAVIFGGGTNRLIIDPGAVFIGGVNGSGAFTVAPGGNTMILGTANGVGTTTLELASATAAGTLNGLGTEYAGFSAVTIDSGAQWTFSGANMLAAGITLTDSGTLTGSGTFTNYGRVTGAAKGVILTTGAQLTNRSGGTITGSAIAVSASSAATVANAGLLSGNPTVSGSNSGIWLSGGGLVSNQSGGTISGFYGVRFGGAGSATLNNAGAILGNPTTTGAAAIYLGNGGMVTNLSGGTITGIYGVVGGVSASGPAVVVNDGGISGGQGGGVSGGQGGVVLHHGGSVTNKSDGTITGYRAVYLTNSGGTVVNAGSLGGNATSSHGSGIKAVNGGAFTNQSVGTITGYRAVYLGGASSTVVNAGSIVGSSAPNYGAGILVTHGGAVTNLSGGVITGHNAIYASSVVLTVTNAGSIGGNTANGTGVDLLFGGTLTNQTGGAISGGTDAVVFAPGHTNRLVIVPGAAFTGTVTGGNTIGAASISTLELASGASIGTLSGLGAKYIDFAQVTIDSNARWLLTGSQTGFATLSNAGTLTAGVTLGAGSFSVTNQAAGTISGTAGILFGATSSGTLIDSGTIIGTGGTAVSFGSGTNLMQLQPGNLRIQGGVFGGAGSSTLEFASSASTGTLTGVGAAFSGFSQGTIDAGAKWVLTGANSFTGTPLTDAGTLSNTGTLGLGPLLSVAGTFLNTGSVLAGGSIAISVVSGGVVSNSGTGAITGVTPNAGPTDGGAGGTGVALSSGAITNAATITGGAGARGAGTDGVGGVGGDGVAVGGGSLTNATLGTIAGGGGGYGYSVGGVGGLGVAVSGGNLTNITGGTIIGGGGGGAGSDGTGGAGGVGADVLSGSVTNTAGGTIAGGGGGSSGNFGGAGGAGMSVLSGSLTNTTLAAIIGGTGGGGDYIGGVGGAGVDVAGGSLTNQGTITGGGGGDISYHDAGARGGYGVVLTNGSMTNQGTITGGGGSAAGNTSNYNGYAGGNGGGGVTVSGGSLTNASSATVIGGLGAAGNQANGGAGGVGIAVNAGNILNLGTILGGAGGSVASLYHDDGGNGVDLNGGVVTNQNTIEGGNGRDNGGGGDGGGYGVSVVAGTLINAGVIDGGTGTIFNGAVVVADAVRFAGAGLLIDDPGASFAGAVVASTTASDVLELASGGAGSLAGFGTSITNFASLVFATGAQWTVAGNASASGLGTLGISGFTFGDTIDLAGFVAISRTFASHALILTDTNSAHVTLAITSSLATGNFRISYDGHGGTDIDIQSVLLYGQTIDLPGITATAETVVSGLMTLTSGASTVGTIEVGTSLSTGDFSLRPDSFGGTDVIVHTAAGTYTSGVTLLVNPTTIGTAAQVSNAAPNANAVTGPGGTAWTLTNLGAIAETSTSGYGIRFASSGTIINAASATIDGGLAGIYLQGGGSVTNQSGGTITGLDGIDVTSAAATVVNAGSIIGGNTADGGFGISFAGSGTITNAAGGVIHGIDGGVQVYGAGATVTNLGQITAINQNLQLGNGDSGVSLINGGVVINGQSGSSPSTASIAGYFYGVQFASANSGTLTNYGTVTDLSGGKAVGMDNGLVVNGPGAATAALIDAGGGDAISISGAGTVVNYATVSGPGDNGYFGVLILGAGSVSNLGTASLIEGYIGVYLASGGSVTNAGTIEASQGTNGVAVDFQGLTNRLIIDPGAVFIGLAEADASPASTLDLASAAAIGTISGIGTAFLGFTQDTIDVGANWVFAGSNDLSGFTLANSGTLIDTGTLTNNATMLGNALNLSGGSLTNQSGGVVESAYIHGLAAGGTDTVVNLGTITDSANFAVYLATAGNVTNAANALISGADGAVKLHGTDATLSNLGRIIATSGNAGYGVYLRNGGVITNGQGGSGTSTASIQGYTGLVFKTVDTANAYGTLNNFGTVTGTGDEAAGVQLNNAGTVLNGQSGATGALIEGGRYGVSSEQGVVVNAATIIATSAASGYYGVRIETAGSVSNLGATALIEGYGGVLLGVDGTVTNAGTIESNQGANGVAVRFTDGNARLIDEPGAVFTGLIFGGSGGTAVLQLASGSSAGTLLGVGPTVTNFTSLVFDPGAQWTVGGTGDADGLGTLGITGFTVGDTIDLTDFDAISRTFASDALVLINGGARETLHFTGSFSAGNFHIGPDAGSGTDITFRSLPLITAGGTATFTGGGSPVTLDSGLTVTDLASTTLVGATISIGSGFTVGDMLNFSPQNGITGSFVSATGVLTLSGTATIAQYQTALDSVSYSFNPSSGDPTNGGGDTSRTIDWVVNDGVSVSNIATSTLTEVHAAPTITAGGTANYISSGTVAVLDPTITVADADSAGMLTGGTVAVTAGAFGGDVLNADTADTSISLSYDATTEILTLSGTDTLADYQEVLRSVTFASSVADPTNAGADPSRAISWMVNDGVAGADPASSTLAITTAVNDPAAFSGTLIDVGVTNETPSTPFSTLAVIDPDSGHTDTVTITLSNPAFGTWSNLAGGSYNASTGVYSFSGTASAATAAIQGLVLTPATPGANVQTTNSGLTIGVVGTDGGPAPLTVQVVATQQILGLASVPASQTVIVGSPDGTGLPAAVPGVTYQAVVTQPTVGGSYTVPAGYAAGFLSGTAGATLQDLAFNGSVVSAAALLVSNAGNDLLIANAPNDTISASSGNDTLRANVNATLLAGNGNDSINASSTASNYLVSVGSGIDSIRIAGSGTVTGGTGTDLINAAGDSSSNVLLVTSQGMQDTVISGAGSATVTASGASALVVGNAGGSLAVHALGTAATVVGGVGAGLTSVTISGAGADVFGRAGAIVVNDQASDVLIGGGTGGADITLAGANASVFGVSGAAGTLAVSVAAGNAMVGVETATTTVDASSASATNTSVFGGYSSVAGQDGAAVITGGPNALLVGTGGSNATINAGSGSDSVFIGTGSLAGSSVIHAGSGSLLIDFVGGAGSATVFGGAGQTSLFGTAGTNVDYRGGAVGALLYANGTDASGETLSGAGSTSNDTLFAAHGNVSLVAGAGDDLLIAGANTGSLGGAGSVVGGSTMVGGSGQALFDFSHAFSSGADVITNLNASDIVYLGGYDTLAGGAAGQGAEAALVLKNATMAGGNTTISPSDGTSITFIGISASQLQGHLFSG